MFIFKFVLYNKLDLLKFYHLIRTEKNIIYNLNENKIEI